MRTTTTYYCDSVFKHDGHTKKLIPGLQQKNRKRSMKAERLHAFTPYRMYIVTAPYPFRLARLRSVLFFFALRLRLFGKMENAKMHTT